MCEKTFKLSKNYWWLWELLHSGATVVYRVNQEQIFDEVGLIKNEDCQHIALNVRYTDEDGLKAWRDIDAPTFVRECERLNLQFFDEVEAPAVTAYQDGGAGATRCGDGGGGATIRFWKHSSPAGGVQS